MDAIASDQIIEKRLGNGLRVLLREDHSAPIASVWTWYRVGSRNELPGQTGISHWVEHMQFKGTPQLAKGQIFRDVSRVGGTLNALTSQDWTAYFETVPASHIDLSLRIESDRMVNSLFAPAEVESERTVILSERQGAENNPGYALYEEVVGAALHAHPYRHMVIGYESDLRQLSRDDLFGHYRRFYHPANAFVVAVGDFDADEIYAQLEGAFGAIPPGRAIPRTVGVDEPLQPGERRVLLRRPSGAPHLRVAYHAPGAAHADLVPLLVTEVILSGGKSMGLGGSGAMGRSSRLYRALVASGLARTAGSDMSITIDPYLFQIGVTGLPGADLSLLEKTVSTEIERLHDELVPNDELNRALRQLESQFVYSAEGVTNQAYWLGQWEIADNWRRAGSLPTEIREVSAEDVRQVVRRYLLPERRTVGWLEPTSDNGAATNVTDSAAQPFVPPRAWGLDGPPSTVAKPSGVFQRAILQNGIPVLGQDRPDSRSVALRVRIPAGSVQEPEDKPGIAFLTARSLLRGFAGRSFEGISTQIDDLGSSISIDAGREFVEARVRCLRDDFPAMIEILAQALQCPDFPPNEVEKLKAEQLGAISEANNDTRATADRLMRRGIYPQPNPFGRQILGETDNVAALDRESVRDFHSARFGPSGATIAVVGGLTGFDRAVAELSDALGSWEARPRVPESDVSHMHNTSTVRATEDIPGKSQADVAVGLATVSRGHPDFYALDIANLILGRLGLMGRLGAEVRDRQGLAYYAFSQLDLRRHGGLWTARAGVDPENIDRALEAMVMELARLRDALVSEEELEDAKSYLTGVLPLALESHDGVAATLLAIEEFGLGLDYLERYPGIIAQITQADVREAARAHLDPDLMSIGIARPPAS